MQERTLEAQARSHIYALLARLARAEVDAELLRELRAPELAAALQEVGLDVNETLPAGDDANLLEDLAREYTRLFLLTFSPHESVQRGEGQLWGDSTVKVRDELEELGLSQPPGRNLLPDHLAVELEVMRHLTEAEAGLLAAGGQEAAATARERQRRFLQEHLLAWGPAYLETIAQHARHPFYQQLGRMGAAFLRTEGE